MVKVLEVFIWGMVSFELWVYSKVGKYPVSNRNAEAFCVTIIDVSGGIL